LLGEDKPNKDPVATGLLCRPDIGRKHFDKLNPESGQHKKPGPVYNSAAATQKLSKAERSF